MKKTHLHFPFFFLIFTFLFGSSDKDLFAQKEITSGLEALLIVGHQEDGTSEAIEKMNKIAGLFKEYDINPHTFYDDEADWEKIKEVAPRCSFLVYSGHGSTLGVDGNRGGLCINSMISTKTLIAELRLKKNALVIFKSVCGGAGSSAGDDDDIGITEAKNRVTHYAYPFFEIGASAYYANNFGDGCYNFLKEFLNGAGLKEAFTNSAEFWTTIEFEEAFEKDKGKQYSIASTKGGGTAIRTTYTNGVKTVEEVPNPKGYKIAYVGEPDFNIKMLAGK